MFPYVELAQLSHDNDIFITIRRTVKIIYSNFKF